MSREKKGILPIIIAVVLIIIILIASFSLWIIWCNREKIFLWCNRERIIFGTAFLNLPNDGTIPNEPTEQTRNNVTQKLRQLGFGIEYEGKYIITFYSGKAHFEETFNTTIVTKKYIPLGEGLLEEIENSQNGKGYVVTFEYSPYIPEDFLETLENPPNITVADLTYLPYTVSWKKSSSLDFLEAIENRSDVDLEDFIYAYNEFTQPITIPKNLQRYVEDVKFSPPAYFSYFTPEPRPPTIDDDYYLNMPNEPNDLANPLRDTLNVPDEYRIDDPDNPDNQIFFDLNGEGITVAILENGFYNHPYFEHMNFPKVELENEPDWFTKILLFFTSTSTTSDTMGHGTVVASNVLSVAPKVKCKIVNRVYFDIFDLWLDTYAAFDQAVNLDYHVDIITCSWGVVPFRFLTDVKEGMKRFMDHAKSRGITVLWCTGNKGDTADGRPIFGGDMEDVISVGGAYPLEVDGVFDPEDSDNWNASTYALSGPSKNFLGRFTPDICGVVGQANQRAQLIMTPTGIAIDILSANRRDGTSRTDGWAVLSGTSSATPQVAGAVALMLQVNRDLITKGLTTRTLTPVEIKKILCETATEVKSGQSASGFFADTTRSEYAYATTERIPYSEDITTWDNHQPNMATGYGVIDVDRAIEKTIEYLQN